VMFPWVKSLSYIFSSHDCARRREKLEANPFTDNLSLSTNATTSFIYQE